MPNEATNFRELLQEDVADVFLGLDEFEELVTFYPAGGGAARQFRVMIEPSSRREVQDAAEFVLEEIVVHVSTDRWLGIAEPRIGDRLKRADDEALYAWNGETRTADVAMRELIYERRKQLAKGGARNR